MIKAKKGKLKIKGSAKEILLEWGQITQAICKVISEDSGEDVTVKELQEAYCYFSLNEDFEELEELLRSITKDKGESDE